jgi:HEAT repeat protein
LVAGLLVPTAWSKKKLDNLPQEMEKYQTMLLSSSKSKAITAIKELGEMTGENRHHAIRLLTQLRIRSISHSAPGRFHMIKSLEKLGPDDEGMVQRGILKAMGPRPKRPILIAATKALKKMPDPGNRGRYFRTLRRVQIANISDGIKWDATDVVMAWTDKDTYQKLQPYIEALKTNDTEKQLEALNSLAELGTEAQLAVPALIILFQDDNSKIQDAAADTFLAIGGNELGWAVNEMARFLQTPDRPANPYAIRVLKASGPLAAKAVVHSYGKHSYVAPKRFDSIKVLHGLGEDAAYATESIIKMVLREDTPGRLLLIETLGEIGKAHEKAIPTIFKMIDHKDEEIKYTAVRALAEADPNSEKSQQTFKKLLTANDWRVRRISAACLAKAEKKEGESIAALRKDLQSNNLVEKWTAAYHLSQMPEKASVAVPDLIKALSSDDWGWRTMSATILGSIGGKTVQPALGQLINMLDAKRKSEVIATINALGNMGPMAAQALPKLKDKMTSTSWRIRAATAETMGKIGDPDGSITETLINSLMDDKIRHALINALADIGKPALPQLKQALSDDMGSIRQGAVAALGIMGKEAQSAIPDLKQLAQKHPEMKDAIANAIELIQNDQ